MCPGFAATPGLVRIVVPEGLNNRGVFALISKMSCMSSSSSPLRVRLPVIMSYSQNQWLHVLARLVPVGNLRSEILMVQSAQNWHRQRATDSLDGTRDRRRPCAARPPDTTQRDGYRA